MTKEIAVYGIGISIIFAFARYAVAAMPKPVAWAGVAAGCCILLATLVTQMNITIPAIVVFLFGALCIGWAVNLSLPSKTEKPAATMPTPIESDQHARGDPTPIRQQRRPIDDVISKGLTKARDDLLAIPKNELSFERLSAWQAEASAATRTAHANGIGVHNPISNFIGAVQGVTDKDHLEAVRMQIVELLNAGIK
jgi:hypothetical protein